MVIPTTLIGDTIVKGSYEFVDHTAEVSVRISAETLEYLFILAARALNELAFGPELTNQKNQRRIIEQTSRNLESLLVNFLSDLLFQIQTTKCPQLANDIEISDSSKLSAQIAQGPRSEMQVDVKAVTYYALSLNQTDTEWNAVITFDV